MLTLSSVACRDRTVMARALFANGLQHSSDFAAKVRLEGREGGAVLPCLCP